MHQVFEQHCLMLSFCNGFWVCNAIWSLVWNLNLDDV